MYSKDRYHNYKGRRRSDYFPKLYNPQAQSKDELINNFIVRRRIFKKLFREIELSKMEYPEQHYMIVGSRGMGKTTLLLRLAYETENNNDLKEWLIPVVLNEEEYGIRKLYEFWKKIVDKLGEKERGFAKLPEKVAELSNQYKDDEEYGKAIYELLEQALKKNKKKIVLFIDNVGDMFSKFSDIEAHRLRKILQSSADIRIFAASSRMADAFFDYNHPFYEFFKVEQLKGLSLKEVEILLKGLVQNEMQEMKILNLLANQKGRLEAVRRLTGGAVRTLIIWFDIFVEKGYEDTYSDLEAILDRLTPIYKHRMDSLSTQQQAIVEAIALNWDAINVKELKQKTRMESKVISAQLSQLVKNHIVTRVLTNTKNHLYMVAERLFNIWYLMRFGNKADQKKVRDLIRFLESWTELRVAKRHGAYVSSDEHTPGHEIGKPYKIEPMDPILPMVAAEPSAPYYSKDEILKLGSTSNEEGWEETSEPGFYARKSKKKQGDRTAQKPRRNGAAQKPRRNGAGQKPRRNGAGQKPRRNGAGQKMVGSETGRKMGEDRMERKTGEDGTGQKTGKAGTGQGDDYLLDKEVIISLMKQRDYMKVLKRYGKDNLLNKMKPLYYALMYFLKDDYPNEFLRMGDEIKETVDEVIAEVEQGL